MGRNFVERGTTFGCVLVVALTTLTVLTRTLKKEGSAGDPDCGASCPVTSVIGLANMVVSKVGNEDTEVFSKLQ